MSDHISHIHGGGEEEYLQSLYVMQKNWTDFDPRRVEYINKRILFETWREVFNKLDGSPSTLERLHHYSKVLQILHLMRF